VHHPAQATWTEEKGTLRGDLAKDLSFRGRKTIRVLEEGSRCSGKGLLLNIQDRQQIVTNKSIL